MREHAIPQDITGYRFHIIGNMTLKQFAEVGAGCLVGFLFYTTNLATVIKWPFIGLSIGLGALIAFVPVEERPLDHWVTTFFKVLYKPTKFFWRRVPKIPEAFSYTPLDHVVTEQQEVDLRPARKQRIKEYLRSVEPPKALDQFDWSRLQQIDTIMSAFDQVVVPQVTIQEGSHKPNLKVRVHTLSHMDEAQAYQASDQTPEIILPQPATSQLNSIDLTQIGTYDTLSQNAQPQPPQAELSTNQVAQELVIPETQSIAVAPPPATARPTEGVTNETTQQQGVYISEVAPTAPVISNQEATTNTQLPFPTIPTEPNKVVGMVLTPNNELISGAIVEIQTTDGQVARAIKSNSLGQFFVTTPLENGTYTMTIEKEGYGFTPVRLDVNGTILPPIEIRSL